MEKRVRGAIIKAGRSFLDEFDSKTRGAMMQRIPGDVDAQLGKVSASEYYSIELWNTVSKAIVAEIPDPQVAYDTMVRCGRHIASNAIATHLRLLIKFLQPAMFARKFPDFFRKDFLFGTLNVDTSRLGQQFLAITISDVDGYEYLGATSLGFVGATLEMIGCKNLKMAEVNVPPSAPQNAGPYRFEYAWSK